MLKNASGGPSLEVILLLLLKGCLERDIDLTHIARVLSLQPARHFRISQQKGALEVGLDADIAVVTPGTSKYDPGTSQTVVKWSAYEGIELPGRVAATFVRGRMVWDGSQVKSSPGFGTFIKPYGKS